jgi:HSP20 family molecular chaperone IbpA
VQILGSIERRILMNTCLIGRDASWNSLNWIDEWHPPYDAEAFDDYYMATLEMPGTPKDEIKIEFTGREVTILGKRESGKFCESFEIPTDVAIDEARANYHDGVLRLYIPKGVVGSPHVIQITDGNDTEFFAALRGNSQKGTAA